MKIIKQFSIISNKDYCVRYDDNGRAIFDNLELSESCGYIVETDNDNDDNGQNGGNRQTSHLSISTRSKINIGDRVLYNDKEYKAISSVSNGCKFIAKFIKCELNSQEVSASSNNIVINEYCTEKQL